MPIKPITTEENLIVGGLILVQAIKNGILDEFLDSIWKVSESSGNLPEIKRFLLGATLMTNHDNFVDMAKQLDESGRLLIIIDGILEKLQAGVSIGEALRNPVTIM